jgi:uncharacterized membrane protein YbhN (UPF0104 family)
VLIVFAFYLRSNSEQFNSLRNVSFFSVVLIVVGQLTVLLSNAILLRYIARLFKKPLPLMESIRVTAYSSLINFFGFLQGGVGFRGYYLYQYYAIPVKKYVAMTTVQYAIVFGLSGLMVLTGLVFAKQNTLTPLLVTALISFIVIVTATFLFIYYKKTAFTVRIISRIETATKFLNASIVGKIILVATLQLLGSALAYYVGLRSIGAEVSVESLFIYTGVSQFSILIALTPGAIGIREGLLLIVSTQMNLSTQDIVLAATIDRAVFFITLGVIAPFSINMKKKINSQSFDAE